MEKQPVIKVEKGADDFKMVNCEVDSEDRPVLKTEAKNTQLIDSKLSSTENKNAELPKEKWLSMNNPIVYIIVRIFFILLLAVVAYLTYKFEWPLKFGFN